MSSSRDGFSIDIEKLQRYLKGYLDSRQTLWRLQDDVSKFANPILTSVTKFFRSVMPPYVMPDQKASAKKTTPSMLSPAASRDDAVKTFIEKFINANKTVQPVNGNADAKSDSPELTKTEQIKAWLAILDELHELALLAQQQIDSKTVKRETVSEYTLALMAACTFIRATIKKDKLGRALIEKDIADLESTLISNRSIIRKGVEQSRILADLEQIYLYPLQYKQAIRGDGLAIAELRTKGLLSASLTISSEAFVPETNFNPNNNTTVAPVWNINFPECYHDNFHNQYEMHHDREVNLEGGNQCSVPTESMDPEELMVYEGNKWIGEGTKARAAFLKPQVTNAPSQPSPLLAGTQASTNKDSKSVASTAPVVSTIAAVKKATYKPILTDDLDLGNESDAESDEEIEVVIPTSSAGATVSIPTSAAAETEQQKREKVAAAAHAELNARKVKAAEDAKKNENASKSASPAKKASA